MTPFAAAFAAALLFASPAFADDVTDAIEDAFQSYEKGDLKQAKRSLDYASQLIGQKNAETLKELLPPAMSGWEAQDGDTAGAAMAVFGGGIQASRIYTKDDAQVELNLIGDSPILAQILAAFSNPALAGAWGKPIKVGANMALEDKEGEIKIVVANRFLISVSGSGTRADKLAYANAIDFAKLEKF